jgi:hypothetical protein
MAVRVRFAMTLFSPWMVKTGERVTGKIAEFPSREGKFHDSSDKASL